MGPSVHIAHVEHGRRTAGSGRRVAVPGMYRVVYRGVYIQGVPGVYYYSSFLPLLPFLAVLAHSLTSGHPFDVRSPFLTPGHLFDSSCFRAG